ncbi:TetR family transcriptional regulator [Aquipuribacter sp. MA13-6]|uniref:TetR family transcriptional regulator n=1 Tax=unclassified Aquipuribacter TaxID=2635084 RepID=UPI003EECF95A
MGRADGWTSPDRGERTREALVAAGVDLLVERGWAALTVRAVAARAQAQPSSIGYHFDSIWRLRHAVVDAALEELFSSVLDDLWRQPTWQQGLVAVVRTLQEEETGPYGPDDGPSADDLVGYAQVDVHRQVVIAQLVAAAHGDVLVRDQLRLALNDVRAQLVPWLETTGVPAEHAWGTAVLLVAVVDGLLLHHLVDRDLALDAVVASVLQPAPARHAA